MTAFLSEVFACSFGQVNQQVSECQKHIYQFCLKKKKKKVGSHKSVLPQHQLTHNHHTAVPECTSKMSPALGGKIGLLQEQHYLLFICIQTLHWQGKLFRHFWKLSLLLRRYQNHHCLCQVDVMVEFLHVTLLVSCPVPELMVLLHKPDITADVCLYPLNPSLGAISAYPWPAIAAAVLIVASPSVLNGKIMISRAHNPGGSILHCAHPIAFRLLWGKEMVVVVGNETWNYWNCACPLVSMTSWHGILSNVASDLESLMCAPMQTPTAALEQMSGQAVGLQWCTDCWSM